MFRLSPYPAQGQSNDMVCNVDDVQHVVHSDTTCEDLQQALQKLSLGLNGYKGMDTAQHVECIGRLMSCMHRL